jgi:hypothetical protein
MDQLQLERVDKEDRVPLPFLSRLAFFVESGKRGKRESRRSFA